MALQSIGTFASKNILGLILILGYLTYGGLIGIDLGFGYLMW